MPAPASLETLLAEWESLTVAERDAIDIEAWDALAEAQRRKVLLKLAIADRNFPLVPMHRQQVNRLIEMERRNQTSLGERMAELRGELDRLDQCRTRLRQVHRSYTAHARGPRTFTGMA